MEDLTRTSFPGIGCFFYRGSKSNGAGGERCFHEVSGVSSEPHEWARDLRTAIRSCRTSTMKHSGWNRSSIAPRPTACRISIGDELLGRGSLFSGIFQPFQKADPWIFRDRIPSQPLFGRIESENERCFPGDPLDPLNRYYGTRKFRNLSSPMEIFPFETFFLMRIFQFHYTPLSLLQLSCNRSLSRNFNNFIFQFKILDYYRWLKNRDNSW